MYENIYLYIYNRSLLRSVQNLILTRETRQTFPRGIDGHYNAYQVNRWTFDGKPGVEGDSGNPGGTDDSGC